MSKLRLLFGTPKIKDKKAFLEALREAQDRQGCVIQAMDASVMVSEQHAALAAEKAARAFAEKRNVAKDQGLEILRYASGQRQIERALSMGVSEASERVALIVMENGTSLDVSDIIDLDDAGPCWSREAVKEAFEIGDTEIEAAGEERIPDLVLERVALTDAYR